MKIFTISPRLVIRGFVFVALGLTGLSLIEKQIGISNVFYVGDDTSIPTWYASFQLFVCASLLNVIAVLKRENKDYYFRHWAGLSLLFYGFSIDEVARIHERIGDMVQRFPLRDRIVLFLQSYLPGSEGLFTYSWVLVGIPFVFVIFLFYLRFILHLPIEIKILFIISGIIFLSGAVGVEMIAARQDYWHGNNTPAYHLITTLEEFLEKMGVVTFMYSLFLYTSSYLDTICFAMGKLR